MTMEGTDVIRTRRPARQHEAAQPVRVVVVGAGFAGLSALQALGRWGASVTLVDRNPYSTFQPLLYQVATAGLTSADVAYPLWAVARKHRARFRRGELARIDYAAQRAVLADGSQLDYDYLIIATGVSAAYFGITGAAEHSLGLYTRHDAVALRNRLMAELERRSNGNGGGNGSRICDGDGKRDGDLTITVVGGGATGVELSGTLAELRNIALPAVFPEIDTSRVHVRLVEQGPALIAPFQSALRKYAHRQLTSRGVEVRLGTTIREVCADCVVLDDGTELPSNITAWAAGVAAPAAAGMGMPSGHGGRLLVGPDLRVSGQDRVFAVGDIGLIDGDQLPQLAQPAIQQGRHAAAQILRLAAGQGTLAFSYHDKGIMATIGRRSAVVQLPFHLRIRGTLAWLAWLGLHLITLLGNRNRISTLINLAWRYLTWSRGGGIIIGDDSPSDD
jgi:NADH:ubiquinone reductase (H+-translocating)